MKSHKYLKQQIFKCKELNIYIYIYIYIYIHKKLARLH